MSSRVSEDSSKFVLPSGMVTSGTELKSLQHKLLQNHYNKSPFNSSKSIINTNAFYLDKNTIDKQKYLNQFDNKTRVNNQKFKNTLSSDLLAQIQYKNLKKQQERRQKIEEQNKLIRHTQKFDSLQRQKINHFNNKYKMEVEQDLSIKQRKRSNDFTKEKSQKQFYNNRYSIQRSESVGNIEKKNYSNPTQKYCIEIEQARKARQTITSNNPQLKRNSSFKITNNLQKVHKIDNMYSSSLNQHYTKHHGYLQTLKQKQIREKQDLRQSLLIQMKQKQQQNKQQRRSNHQIPYTTKDYKFVHHPINNPVDFKYAHDNRYVLGELKSIA